MKVINSILLALVAIFILTGCDIKPPTEAKVLKSEKITVGGSGFSEIHIKVIVLDGNEYYATRTYSGHWTLCPKLPPKHNEQ